MDTGKLRMVWRDFPLDQLALAAAAVARALPPERYEGFIGALFSTQDRWAFARGADNLAEIAKIAALAGMSRAEVDAALADQALSAASSRCRHEGAAGPLQRQPPPRPSCSAPAWCPAR